MGNFYGVQEERSTIYGKSATAFPALMRKVYLWMTLGLAMTGLAAWGVANSGLVYQMGNAMWLLFIAELGLVWYLSSRIMKMSYATASILFAVFSVINGVTLAPIFMVYTYESIASTFFVTSGMFGAMAAVGYFTKKDMSGMGRIFFMALIGLIIASVVNIFLGSSMLYWVVTYAGVVIFCGLTAYDTQRIKQMYMQLGNEENDLTLKLGVLGALTLYLDFINLFLYLLRILGASRD